MYIPICENCNLCVPSRINLNKFKISKSNKRTLRLIKILKLTKASKMLKYQRYKLFTEYCKKDIKIAKWVK